MNAYERERAECAAEEAARADRRFRAWRRQHTTTLTTRPSPRAGHERITEQLDQLRKAG